MHQLRWLAPAFKDLSTPVVLFRIQNILAHAVVPSTESGHDFGAVPIVTSLLRQPTVGSLIYWLGAVDPVADALLCVFPRLFESRARATAVSNNLSAACKSELAANNPHLLRFLEAAWLMVRDMGFNVPLPVHVYQLYLATFMPFVVAHVCFGKLDLLSGTWWAPAAAVEAPARAAAAATPAASAVEAEAVVLPSPDTSSMCVTM